MRFFSTLVKIFKAIKLDKQLTDNLCQYKMNEEKCVTMSLDALTQLSDEELFDATFLRLERSSFMIEDVEEFEERMERYPFGEYDDSFYDIEPIQTYLEKFARAKITELY